MSLGRGLTDEETVGDSAIREAKGDKFRYFDLPLGELRERTDGSAAYIYAHESAKVEIVGPREE